MMLLLVKHCILFTASIFKKKKIDFIDFLQRGRERDRELEMSIRE